MERVSVSSSNVASIGYDPGANVLEVEFHSKKGNSVYQYAGVPRETWLRLLDSPSKGQFLNGHVKGTYPATKVS